MPSSWGFPRGFFLINFAVSPSAVLKALITVGVKEEIIKDLRNLNQHELQ